MDQAVNNKRDELVHEVSKIVGNRTKLLYALAIAMDVLANSIDQSIRSLGNGAAFSQSKKLLFKRYAEAAKAVDTWYEKMAEPTIVDATQNWNEYEGYKQDANEMIRLIMRYLNATGTVADYERVSNLLMEMQPEDKDKIFSDNEINRFSFVARNRKNPN